MAITLDGSNGVNVGTSGNTTGAVVINSTLSGTEKQLALRDASNGWTRKIGVDSSNNMGFYDGDTERMRIDSAGRVTMPYQPAFRAGSNATQSMAANTRITVQFANVSANIGGHFNSSNGRFTAPVDGMYLFTTTLLFATSSVNARIYAEFYKNGNQVFGTQSHKVASIDEDCSATGSMVINMNAGDYIEVRCKNTHSTDDIHAFHPWANFTGCLLG